MFVGSEGVMQGVWSGRSGEVGRVGEVTQVGDIDTGGGTVQSPCLNLQTDPA